MQARVTFISIKFRILETEVRTSLAERLGYETYTTRLVSSETQNANIPKVNCPITEPVSNYNQPAKKTTKTKEDKAFDKAYDKACKAAEAANKKFNRSSECLKVCGHIVQYVIRLCIDIFYVSIPL